MGNLILNPGFFLLAPLSIASFCFLASVGSPDRFIDWPYLWLLFRNISPYFWAATGIALCVGTSILGAAWCVQLRQWRRHATAAAEHLAPPSGRARSS